MLTGGLTKLEKKKNLIELILETNRLLDWAVYIEQEYKQYGFTDLLKIVVVEAYRAGYLDGKKRV